MLAHCEAVFDEGGLSQPSRPDPRRWPGAGRRAFGYHVNRRIGQGRCTGLCATRGIADIVGDAGPSTRLAFVHHLPRQT